MSLAVTQLPETLQRALVLHESGQLAQAQAIYEEILRIAPGHYDATNLLGTIAVQTGNQLQAAHLFGKAIEIDPTNVVAYCNYALALTELRQFDAALANYDRAIEINGELAEAHFKRANVLRELKRFDAALASYRRAIELEPDFAEGYLFCGDMLRELKQFDAALVSYDRAISIIPDYEDAYTHRGYVLTELEQFDAALASYDRAISLKPDYAEAYTYRGYVLTHLKQHDAAMADYDRAIALKPNYADAYLIRSIARLLRGDLENGWIDYEWRRRNHDGSPKDQRFFAQSQWLGEQSIAGKKILLHGEQGLGDTLQFCRYVKSVAALGSTVILEVQWPLKSLLAGLEGVRQVVACGEDLPEFEYQCPLMSLPLAFKTTLTAIPSSPRYLNSDPSKVARWHTSLGQKTAARIGLVWRGNPMHMKDHNRSIELPNLIRHLPPGLQYVSLQKDIRDDERRILGSWDVLQFADELEDFSDTAALCECMDVVISVDTSVAHLSGALGKQLWLLLPSMPDWRWLLDREDSPWYPTATLYRRQSGRNWSSVLERVEADLIRTFLI